MNCQEFVVEKTTTRSLGHNMFVTFEKDGSILLHDVDGNNEIFVSPESTDKLREIMAAQKVA